MNNFTTNTFQMKRELIIFLILLSKPETKFVFSSDIFKKPEIITGFLFYFYNKPPV